MERSFLSKNFKTKNKGFTIVELVCAVAILAIVGLSVFGFISISTSSYKTTANEVNLQYEAQQVANQIKELIIDSNRAVCAYESGKKFLVLNEKEITESGVKTYEYPAVKIWLDTDGILYYAVTTFSHDDLKELYTDSGRKEVDMKTLGERMTKADGAVLSEHVESFLADDTYSEENGTVKLNISFKYSDRTYSLNPTIVMRNKVIASENVAEIFDGVRRIRDKGKIRNIDILFKGVSVNGKTLNYSANGINKPNAGEYAYVFSVDIDAYEMSDEVEWKLEGSTTAEGGVKSRVENGSVYISCDEKSSMLVLSVTSVADPTKSAMVTLDLPAYDMSKGYADSISVVNLSSEVDKGKTKEKATFKVSLSYENGDKLTDADKGYDIKIEKLTGGTAEAGAVSLSKGVGSDEYTVDFDYTNADATYRITATARAKCTDGSKAEAYCDFKVSDLREKALVFPSVTLTAPGTSVARNSSMNITAAINDFSVVSNVSWSLTYTGGFNNKHYYKQEKYVTLNNTRNESKASYANVAVDYNLSWNDTFSVSVMAVVTGEDANGEAVRIESAPLNISIIPVKVTAVKSDRSDTISRTSESKSFTYSIENIVLNNDITVSVSKNYTYKELINGNYQSNANEWLVYVNNIDTAGKKGSVTFSGDWGINDGNYNPSHKDGYVTMNVVISSPDIQTTDKFDGYHRVEDWYYIYYFYQQSTYSNTLTWTVK